MSKTIIFCADGTWNGPGENDQTSAAKPATNVLKLFLNLAGADSLDTMLLKDEQERTLAAPDGTVTQVSKYLHGVGDSTNFLVRLLGGAVGAGLITRIVRGYTFISRNYKDGDRIFVVGFSRGAYTARALAGLIASQGLLDASKLDLSDKDQAYRLGAACWYAYRQKATPANWFSHLVNVASDLPMFFSRPVPDNQRVPAKIDTVAVWDTVGSYGIPTYSLHAERIDPFQFADLKLSASVRIGLQAIAVDELRADFTPTFWDADTRVTQCLFPGAHADVGGGYPMANAESALSDCSLRWMTDQLAALGVQFVTLPAPGNPDAAGVAHQPWSDLPWRLLSSKARTLPKGLTVSQALSDRRTAASVRAFPSGPLGRYEPPNLGAYPIA
jgi:uncharacterized protein (DUF2235 family)